MNILDKPLSELKNALGTDFEKGLDSVGVKKNTEAFGPNSLFDGKQSTASSFFKALLSDVMPWLFVTLCILSVFLKHFGYVLPCLILFSIYIIIRFAVHYVLGIIDKKIGAYRKIHSTVIRNGQSKRINARFLVPGDILTLKKGDFVPCDCIVINSQGFSVYESYITSNPDAVPKKSQYFISSDDEPYHNCILFTGSVVFEGEAKALVCNTGKNIFKVKNGPLKKVFHNEMPKIHKNNLFVGKQIYLLWILMCFVIFIVGVLMRYDVFSMIFLSATLSLAALGDCIPTLSEVAVYAGISRLNKKYGCVLKNYQTIDTFNATNSVFIENFNYFLNSMPKISSFYINNTFFTTETVKHECRDELLKYAMASMIAQPKSRNYIDISLSKYAASCGITVKSAEEEFIYISKYSGEIDAVLTFKNGEYAFVSRGSASQMLERCKTVRVNNSVREIGRNERFALKDHIRDMELNSQSVIAIVKQTVTFSENSSNCILDPQKLTLLGFIGFYNPINTEAAKSMLVCRKNGINVVLMEDAQSGAHADMARSISLSDSNDLSINSAELAKTDEGLLRADLKKYKIFSRLSQHQRLYISKLTKESGNIITCIPNSLEDIPLQASADASITAYNEKLPAANYFSDAIFMRRDFSIFNMLVKNARAIYHNAGKMLLYILTNQFFICTLIIAGMIFEKKLIFHPAVLMLYGIFSVLPSALAISCEPPPEDKPLSPPSYSKYIFNLLTLLPHPFVIGLSGGITSVLVYRMYNSDEKVASAASLISLFASAYFTAVSLRNDELFIRRKLSRAFSLLPGISIVVLTVLFSIPSLSEVFGLRLPNLEVALISTIFSFIPFAISEIVKKVKNLTK